MSDKPEDGKTENPFQFLNSILSNKQYIDLDGIEDQYWPTFINVGLSQHIDCILFANEMNLHPYLNKRMHYDYLFHSVRGVRRKFGKWSKKTDDKVVQAIADYYKIRLSLAKEYQRALNKEQIDIILNEVKDGNV